jgi:hypothetical protein
MLDSLPTPSAPLYWGFVLLPLLVAGAVVWAIGRTSGGRARQAAGAMLALWLGSTAALGASGVLDAWAPPRMFLVFALVLGFLAWAARQPFTLRLGDLPLELLVGFQAFRIAVEWLLHLAVLEEVAHPSLTWTGTNFDIIPGITALALAPWASRIHRRALQAWNVGMAGVLVVTVVTAVLAAPTPFRQIAGDPPNVFIASFPFIWLPTVLVASAWLGHIVLFRRLRRA